eukprot:3882027-Rhodomonas_salina.2
MLACVREGARERESCCRDSGNLRGLNARSDADLGSQQSLLSGRCFPTEGKARLNTARDPNVQPLNQ